MPGRAGDLDRSAQIQIAYAARLQQPDGIFNHATDGPAAWGRGNGFAAFGLMLAQFAICVALAVLFASFSTPTLAVIFTLALVGAGFIFSEIRPFWLLSDRVQMKQLVHVLDFTLPNMGLIDAKEALTYGDPVGLRSFATRLAYGFGYAGVVVALAAAVFSRRDIR